MLFINYSSNNRIIDSTFLNKDTNLQLGIGLDKFKLKTALNESGLRICWACGAQLGCHFTAHPKFNPPIVGFK